MLEVIARVGPSDANVLIEGENGSGKGVVARALHAVSQRSGKPFVTLNAGGISEGVFESELFGHVRGAFTDARADRVGRFELADGGTLFLDEIGNVPPAQQAKLLRVLETGEFERVGSSRTVRADVRILSATNADLHGAVAAGRFRQDLLFRLNTIEIRVPPLRERREDIPLLARQFLDGARAPLRQARRRFRGRRPSRRCWPIPGPATSASSTTPSSAPCSWPRASGSAPADLGLRRGGEAPRLEELSLEEVESLLVRKAMDRFGGNVSQAAPRAGPLAQRALSAAGEVRAVARTVRDETADARSADPPPGGRGRAAGRGDRGRDPLDRRLQLQAALDADDHRRPRWLVFTQALRERVVRPLQTVSNLLAAMREEDFSIRARGARLDDPLGEVLLEVNALAETLREQRLGALEATALLSKVMAEIAVAVFAFDDGGRLRLVNRFGETLLGQPEPRLLGRSAEELGLAPFLEEQTARRSWTRASRAARGAGRCGAAPSARAACRTSSSCSPT